jgi:type IV fimbrial biogenesis protein FimT
LLADDRGSIVHGSAALHRTSAFIRGKTRGFTLLELMLVVVMIGIVVALGIPSIAAQMRDRRTNQAAHEVSLLYRQARSVAMGRGTAVVVRFRAASRGSIEVLAAKNTDVQSCLGLPAPSCNANVWDTANTVSVGSFDPTRLGVYDNVKLSFANIALDTEGDLCFSPLGRPYWRNVFVGDHNFLPMNEVPTVTVAPVDDTGLTRTVLVVPTGASRLAL